MFEKVGIGSDVAVGGNANDYFIMAVDGQVDKIDGGAGEDTIDYRISGYALDINLANHVVSANIGGTWQPVTVVYNVSTAKTFGLKVPPTLLARVHEVIRRINSDGCC